MTVKQYCTILSADRILMPHHLVPSRPSVYGLVGGVGGGGAGYNELFG